MQRKPAAHQNPKPQENATSAQLAQATWQSAHVAKILTSGLRLSALKGLGERLGTAELCNLAYDWRKAFLRLVHDGQILTEAIACHGLTKARHAAISLEVVKWSEQFGDLV